MAGPLRRASLSAAGLVLAALVAAVAAQAPQTLPVRRIAVFGSSVANGTGDESGQEGYAGRLRALLQPRGWEVVNQSRGGDNTEALMSRFEPSGTRTPGTRYLTAAAPGYVIVGLSLGNEGIRAAEGEDGKDGVFERYTRGIRAVVDRSRAQGIVPVVALCYTRNDFTPVEYEYTQRTNARINDWDVPSVNLLGAVDDGAGRWVDGFWWDGLHPNGAGHAELATTFVPTLFDALEAGKPTPRRPAASGFARLSAGAALTFAPEATVHPFAFGITARATGEGPVARVTGVTLTSSTARKTVTRPGQPPATILSVALSPAAPSTASIGIRDGVWVYTSTSGEVIASSVRADARWHQLLVSHYTARGESLFFVDGVLAGRTPERLETNRFVVGAARTSRRLDVKDVLIFRSALHAGEVAALHGGKLLQASLEIYAPLADRKFETGMPVDNRAQSLAVLALEGGRAWPVAR